MLNFFHFFKDLSITDRFTVDRHRGILTMKKVEEGDSGPYICIAENKAGTQQVTVQIEVFTLFY